MPATYEPIATTTLGSAAASITFGSIPNTYTDLRIVFSGTSTVNDYTALMRFNSDTGTNYSYTNLNGTGSAAGSNRSTDQTSIMLSAGISSTYPDLLQVDIFSYRASVYKTVLIAESDDCNGSGYVRRRVCLWRSTAAITSIDLISNTTTFKAGTTATLYGIKAA